MAEPAAQSVATQRPALPRAELVPVYVWELPVRLTHWLIALSIGVLTVTGLYIGNPFVRVPGEAGDHFVMGTMKVVHDYAAIVFTLSVLSRIAWMFVGNRWARWNQLVPATREGRRGIPGTLAFYLFARPTPPRYVGHNPVAGATYTLVFLLYLVMVATGLGLYGMSAHVDSPLRFFAGWLGLFGGAQGARWIHHVVMWLLLGFAVHHVASAILVSRVEKNGILDSIFSGYKFVPPSEAVGGRVERRRRPAGR
jgi:Ni/Fe-hydrogenase 1 B-type cytochrome subunit